LRDVPKSTTHLKEMIRYSAQYLRGTLPRIVRFILLCCPRKQKRFHSLRQGSLEQLLGQDQIARLNKWNLRLVPMTPSRENRRDCFRVTLTIRVHGLLRSRPLAGVDFLSTWLLSFSTPCTGIICTLVIDTLHFMSIITTETNPLFRMPTTMAFQHPVGSCWIVCFPPQGQQKHKGTYFSRPSPTGNWFSTGVVMSKSMC
jgi:hypothetical protein